MGSAGLTKGKDRWKVPTFSTDKRQPSQLSLLSVKFLAQLTNSVFIFSETQENKIKRENIQIQKLNLTRLEKPMLRYVLVDLESNNYSHLVIVYDQLNERCLAIRPDTKNIFSRIVLSYVIEICNNQSCWDNPIVLGWVIQATKEMQR